MANHNNEDTPNRSNPDGQQKDSELDKSIVQKLVSGLITNTPLSKWFGSRDSTQTSNSLVRKREEMDQEKDDGEEGQDEATSYTIPPPTKRAKFYTRPDMFQETFGPHYYGAPMNSAPKFSPDFTQPGPSGVSKSRLNPFPRGAIDDTESDSEEDEVAAVYTAPPPKPKTQTKADLEMKPGEKTPKIRSLFQQTSEPPSRSLFSERSLTPHFLNTSLSSRRPTFNASTFRSPNFVDRTLSTKRIMSSPFYGGNTTYGGASAYPTRRSARDDTHQKIRQSILVKPICDKVASSSENTSLSKTARKILSALEQYSTPINDAKKIPVTPRRQGILTKYIGASPYARKKAASNTELQVPTIPDLLQMKQKQRLQDSTENMRQIAANSVKLPQKQKPVMEEYQIRKDDSVKYTNKIKSNLGSVRQKTVRLEDEIVPVINLPNVSLPITTLPKFELAPLQSATSVNLSKKTTATVTQTTEKMVYQKAPLVTESRSNKPQAQFIFSKPVVISENSKPLVAVNCFKFSEPASCRKGDESKDSAPKAAPIQKNNGDSILTKSSLDKFKAHDKWECPTCLVWNEDSKLNCVACDEPKPSAKIAPSSTASFGSKFKPASDTWECPTCLVRNGSDSEKCVACSELKPRKPKTQQATNNTASSNTTFGDKFKPASDTWECAVCMIRNKNDLSKCQACETPKKTEEKTTTSIPLMKSSFGDKFKATSDTWECAVCMIRNKNSDTQCAACTSSRPGAAATPSDGAVPKPKPTQVVKTSGSGFNFGLKPVKWECKACWIWNKDELKKCAACESLREGSEEPPLAASAPGFGDMFKAKLDEWECTSCLVRNKSDVDTCVCCGVVKAGAVKPTLKIQNSADGTKSMSTFNFGINPTGNGNQFSFGIPPPVAAAAANLKEEAKNVAVISAVSTAPSTKDTKTTPPTFTFGNPASASTASVFAASASKTPEKSNSVGINPLLRPSEKLPERALPAAAGFSFGEQKTEIKENKPMQKAMFEFKSPAVTTNGQGALIFGSPPNKTVTETKSAPVTAVTTAPPSFKFTSPPAAATTSINGTPAAPMFQFTSPPKTAAPEKPNLNGFDNNTPAAAPKFSFGAPKQDTAPKPTFGFVASSKNSSTEPPPSKIPNFNFGPGEKPMSNSAPMFSFGANSVGAPAKTEAAPPPFSFTTSSAMSSSGFTFGGGGKSDSFPPAFGAAATAAKNGVFNFGTNPNNNNQKAVFTFGANQSTQGKNGPPPAYNFEAATGAAPPAVAPGGGFNFTGTPSFNFNDGGGATSQPQRKIMRGRRRTQR